MSKYIKLEDALNCVNGYFLTGIHKAIESLPTIEVSEDAISRKAVEEMLMDSWVDGYEYSGNLFDDLEKLPSVIPQVPSEDAISREWIKNALLEYGFTAPDMTVTELIEDAPSVVPQPKQGEWIEDNLGTLICSECKRPRRDSRINHTRFCNSCGAKMKGASYE